MSMYFRGTMFLSAIVAAVPARGGVPNEIHHQGVIAVHGERFTGEGEFYFALVDELGYNLWTNDGTNVGPTSQRPGSPVTLTVVNGVYRVRLGNTDTQEPPTTTPIPRAVFNENDHVALRIWFDDGVNGIHQLSPDQVLTGVPYAQRLPNVFVDEDTGNVGVGTTAPTSKLSVSGSADFSGNVGIATTTPSNALSVEGNADVTGDLGLGTINPQNRLDVEGSAVVGSSYAGTTPGPANGLLVEGNVGIGTAEPASKLSVAGGADFSGNVGVGTDDPQSKLDIDGSAVVGSSYAGTNPGPADGLLVEGDVGIGTPTPASKLSVAGDADFSGNVGIGTTSPEKKLHIGGQTPDSEGMIRLQSKSGTGGAFRTWDIGVPETDQVLSGAGYSFVIDDVENGEEPEVTVKYDTGNVGIGTTDPQAKLDVNGSIRVWEDTDTSWTNAMHTLNVVLTRDAPGQPTCNEATRGTIFVTRLDLGATGIVDALCLCGLQRDGNYWNVCFWR